MKRIAILAAAISLSACTTIHFDNGEVNQAQQPKAETWHHNVLLDLVEVSAPVDPAATCGDNEWASVKTERTFLNGLASSFVNVIGPIWYPKTAQVTCK